MSEYQLYPSPLTQKSLLSMVDNPVSLLPYRRTWATMKGIQGVYQNPSGGGDTKSLFAIIPDTDWFLNSGCGIKTINNDDDFHSLYFPSGSIQPGNILFGSFTGTVTPGTDNTGYTTQYTPLFSDGTNTILANFTLVRPLATGGETLRWTIDVKIQFAPPTAATWSMLLALTGTVHSSGGTLIKGPETIVDTDIIDYDGELRFSFRQLFDTDCDTTCIITTQSAFVEMI